MAGGRRERWDQETWRSAGERGIHPASQLLLQSTNGAAIPQPRASPGVPSRANHGGLKGRETGKIPDRH